MTAINVIQAVDAAHVITDGLVSGHHCLVSKVWTLPHINAAISVSGGARSFALLGALAHEASLACSRPEYLFTQLVDLVKKCQEKYAGRVPAPMTDDAPDHFIAIAAAFIKEPCLIGADSISRGPLVGMVASHVTAAALPYTLLLQQQQVGGVFLYPDVAPIPQRVSDYFAANPTVEDAAARIIEIQRERVSAEFPNAIGGFAQLTTITETGTLSRVVKHWPDHLRQAGGFSDELDVPLH